MRPLDLTYLANTTAARAREKGRNLYLPIAWYMPGHSGCAPSAVPLSWRHVTLVVTQWPDPIWTGGHNTNEEVEHVQNKQLNDRSCLQTLHGLLAPAIPEGAQVDGCVPWTATR